MTNAIGGLMMAACPIDLVAEQSAQPSFVHYVIVRGDLPHGLQVAQVTHAAGESAGFPLPENTIAVALSVADEIELRTVAAALDEQCVRYKLVVENEGQYAGQAMAIGVVPTTDRAAIRRATSRLRAVR